MEVTIGVQNLAREIVVDTDLTAEAVATAVADALGGAPPSSSPTRAVAA